jgi:hypothetical protein
MPSACSACSADPTAGRSERRAAWSIAASRPPLYGERATPMPPGRRARLGPVAQWLEPTAHNGLVGGSSPPGPTSAFDALRLRRAKFADRMVPRSDAWTSLERQAAGPRAGEWLRSAWLVSQAAQLAPPAGRAKSSPRWRLSLRPTWESREGGCFDWPHSLPLGPPTETLARVRRDRLHSCHHSAYRPKGDHS